MISKPHFAGDPRRCFRWVPAGFKINDQAGFSLVEFLISSLIMLVIAGAAFQLLAQAHLAAANQADMREVLDNARLGIDIIARHLRQAANDPYGCGFEGITVVSAAEVRIRSDLTGSAGPDNADKGDPDGDTDDSSEDVTIRYNAKDLTIEVVPEGGPAQAIAGGISAFSLEFLDSDGSETLVSAEIHRVRVSLTGTGALSHPRTRQRFCIQLSCDVRLATRR